MIGVFMPGLRVFRTLNVRLVTRLAQLTPLVGQYLGETKAAR